MRTLSLLPLVVAVSIAQSSDLALDGLWLTDGYGELLEFKGSTLRIYEITSVSCILSEKATRERPSKTGEIIFVNRRQKDTFRITPASSADKRWLNDGGVSNVELHRTGSRPEACNHELAETPANSYEVFWQTFSEQYPFFTLRQVDWNTIDKQFRRQVTMATSPEQLFNILKQMIEPLHDAHTSVEAKSIHKRFEGYRGDAKPLQSKQIHRIREIIQKNYLQSGLQHYCKHYLHYGVLRDSIGYLRIDGFPEDCDALDDIFRNTSELAGLVIDERINGGGSDKFGLAIASRLANQEYLAYSKIARNDIHDASHHTAAQAITVNVSPRPGFRGAVVLLMGHDSLSGAETFAMALFGREPHIIRVGDNTQGVFSDVLDRTLPNRWHFSLPNEIYLAKDGTAFNAIGVPPDIRVPVFSEEDLKAGRDSALEKAIELLANSASSSG